MESSKENKLKKISKTSTSEMEYSDQEVEEDDNIEDEEDDDEEDDDDDDDDNDNDYYYNYDNYNDNNEYGNNHNLNEHGHKIDSELLYDLECLNIEQAKNLLNEIVDQISTKLNISPSLAKLLLHLNEWNTNNIIQNYLKNPTIFLIQNNIKPSLTQDQTASSSSSSSLISSSSLSTSKTGMCPVCTHVLPSDQFHSLDCKHYFCKYCWGKHFEVQINQGITLEMSCMMSKCTILVPEDLILNLLKSSLHDKYEEFTFRHFIKSHPQLRFCPGLNCDIVMKAKENKPKKAICNFCKTNFCYQCGIEYHAPTDCNVIKKWLTKCADDSETANYISAHTKDCPKCHICIEKNGGCNHMQCYHCKHEFCWMCLGDWKAHGSEYYECSRYKENPNIAKESAHAQAREALKKYLHYYERWENHCKSLKLEAQTLEAIKTRINSKVMNSSGTWIDWQYLIDAAYLLAKCRYTLQYTYPYAYYMQQSVSNSRKELFEYQQAQLEAEIENLSWKIERAETTDRGELENQMDIAEKRRITLLKDFQSF